MTKKYDLSGTWNFSMGQADLKDTIELPGTTAQAHKGVRNNKRETGYLTEKYPFVGRAYYEKRVQLSQEELDRPVYLMLERTRKTKVWIDGRPAGQCDSLTTPHTYELTSLITNTQPLLRIEVENEKYPIPGGHLTSPDTQTNWNGITGEISLTVYDTIRIRNISLLSYQKEENAILLQLKICNEGAQSKRKLGLSVQKQQPDDTMQLITQPVEGRIDKRQEYEEIPAGESVKQIRILLQEPVIEWSEYTPVLYQFHIDLETGSPYVWQTGFRRFEAKGHFLYCNDHQIMLRGKHDAMLFPLTGAAPTTTAEWLRVMQTAKEYGINHYRFHTCCPPEAAFCAADLLGIYMEPELAFWGTVTREGDADHDEKAFSYLRQEGIRILRTFGHHPSFCMMSLGNELWGSKESLGEMLELLRQENDRILYTQGSNNFQFVPDILPQEDFYVGVRLAPADENGENDRLLRGSCACCDAPMGHVQLKEPGTRHNYDAAILGQCNGKEYRNREGVIKPSIPVIQHETGQYEMYPDYRELEQYQGVLEPANLQIFKERLEQAGMKELAQEFFESSGKLAMQCYQEELEAAHRSRYLAGYQLLDLQDYTGQGTALVGVLNSLMESKGLLTAKQWRSFCSDCVLLAEFDRYCVEAGTEFDWTMKLSYYRWTQPLTADRLDWCIRCNHDTESGQEIWQKGSVPIPANAYGVVTLGEASCRLPEVSKVTEWTLELALGQEVTKQYTLWLFPNRQEQEDARWLRFLAAMTEMEAKGDAVMRFQDDDGQTACYLTTQEEQARAYFEKGERVLYFAYHKSAHTIPGMYCTDFWNYPMFRSICEDKKVAVPVGTLGLMIRKEHPALADFPCRSYTTPQWYQIIEQSDCAILDRMWEKEPIVQVIDNVERNHRLSILYEEKTAGKGLLLTCMTRWQALEQDASCRQYGKSILAYCMQVV